MDTATVAKTWVDFGFHVFDAIKDHIIPVVIAALTGWLVPSPLRRGKK